MLCQDLAHCIVAAQFCHQNDAARLQILGQSDMYATYLFYMHADYFGPLSPHNTSPGLPCT